MPITTVLVTGAAGQIGRAVLDLLAGSGIATTALVLDSPGGPASHAGLAADRVVVGDAGDVNAVRSALTGADGVSGVDAVIHLAAIPAPEHGTAEQVFSANTRATFVVLEEAGRAGVRRAAIASSYAIAGLTFATRPVLPAYLPFDVASPLQISDPYALAKRADEATAEMMARRHGMGVVALRLPFVSGASHGLSRAAAKYASTPAAGVTEVWSYLDVRDAARAFLLGLRAPLTGAHVVYVAAPETLAPYPTEWLLDTYLPGVPRRAPFPGRAVPIDLEPARHLLGFTAHHPMAIPAAQPT